MTRTVTMLISLVFVLMQGCYSFSGASFPSHMQSVAVPLFDDTSQAGIAQFRESITRSIINKIETQTSLNVEPDPARASAVLTGAIVSYNDEPSQLGSSTERAITNRITIVIRGDFDDRVKNTRIFSQTFVGFADYSVGNYSAQQTAIQSAINQAVEEMFNRMISNW
ncbi:MAG TPA: LPS assembly lipoprotein LptE [Chlorobaculum sp.]|nr:LPS assembly lipoprotein LptE [Chlorobaculum sp.]